MGNQLRIAALTIVFYLTTIFSGAVNGITANNCDSNGGIKISNLRLNPPNIKPGHPLAINANWVISKNIQGPLKIEFKFFKTIFAGIRLQLPCSDNIGSCTYNNACNILPATFCNLSNGAHEASVQLKVPQRKDLSGTYEYEANLFDSTGKIGCVHGNLSVE